MMRTAFFILVAAAAVALGACAQHSSTPVVPSLPQGMSQAVPDTTASGTLSVDFTHLGPAVSAEIYGASQVTWTTITNANTSTIMKNVGLRLIRWPGGSESDEYHWANGGSLCPNQGGYIASGSTFDNFMQDDVIPAGLEAAVTLNYGTNPTCNGGGDPSEAASWVAYAKSKNYDVRFWTVGNEVFGSWELDMHTPSHDAVTYTNAVDTGYYPQIKTKDAAAQVGVVVAGNYEPSWDSYVLHNAKYDFVELHYYAQSPGGESDSWLLTKGPQDFASNIKQLKGELTTAGHPNKPIYVGELNSVYSSPGKQSVSIVNALWAGMVLGEAMKHGVKAMTWWTAFGDCQTGNNNSSTLYGWQDFGSYALFSDGIPTPWECPGISETIPFGTPFPSARAYQVVSQYVTAGSKPAATTLATLPLVRAYAFQLSNGYALLLFNLSETASASVAVSLNGASKATFTMTKDVYGKAQYDASKTGAWNGPVATNAGTVAFPHTITLPPYSITAVLLR